MGSVSEQVTCALCGTKMSVDTQYCPKCGSLNAHFGYHKLPGSLEQASPAAMPAVPATHSPAVQRTAPDRHVPRIPVSPVQEYRPQSQDQETLALPAWQGPTVDDPDVELSPTWREGIVRVPVRRIVPAGSLTASPNPNTAFLLEMFGIVGFLGLGHMYAGRFTRGLLLMIGWWGVFATLILLAIITEAFGLIFVAICFGPGLSGNWISKELKRNAQAGPRQ